MRIAFAALALVALMLGAQAQIWIMSPANQTGSGNHAAVTPCNAGQLDFSVSTGCNLIYAGH